MILLKFSEGLFWFGMNDRVEMLQLSLRTIWKENTQPSFERYLPEVIKLNAAENKKSKIILQLTGLHENNAAQGNFRKRYNYTNLMISN